MKITFLSTGHWYHDHYPAMGGSEVQIEVLAQELSRRGHETTILTRDRGFKEKNLDGVRVIGVKNILGPYASEDNMKAFALLSRLFFSRDAYNTLKKLDFDVLTLWDKFSALLPSHLPVPKLYRPDWDAFDYARDFLLSQSKINYFFFNVKKWADVRVMKKSNVIISPNTSIKKYLNSKGITNVALLPNSFFVDKFRNEGEEDYILYVGRLTRSKGIRYLIEAFSKVASKYEWYRLIIIGRGEEQENLKALVAKLGINDKVEFIHHWLSEDELLRYYARCTVFVLPTLFETFGNVVVEAMASSKPVIATRTIGPSEIIEHGKNGFLVDPGNSSQLAKFLDLTLGDERLRKSIGVRARRDASKNFDSKTIATKFLKICEQVYKAYG